MSYMKQSPEKAMYVSGSAAYAGQYKINRRDGKLKFSKTLFALEGKRLPMRCACILHNARRLRKSRSCKNVRAGL